MEEAEKLIELIYFRPELYNLADKNYKNIYLKKDIWKEIDLEYL